MEVKLAIPVQFVFLLFMCFVKCFDHDFTIEIKPGETECFYVTVDKETDIEVEFQVLDGGDLDINFYAQDPSQRMIAAQMKKSESSHKFGAKEIGDYKICFDNSYSRFSRKMVYFEISSSPDDDVIESEFPELQDSADAQTELIDLRMEDFKSTVTNVRGNLDRAIQSQTALKLHETRDRNVQESNFERVNTWSVLQLVVMVSVALIQVLMIRNLFDQQSKSSHVKMRT